MYNYVLNFTLWTIIFFQGLIRYSGLPTAIYKVGIPLIVLVLLILKLATKPRFEVKCIWVFFSLIGCSLLSFMINEGDLFSFIYFVAIIIFPYLYFLLLLNETNEQLKKKLLYYIIILILIQLPASFIKYFVLGISEGGVIGTIATDEGSVATIFPLYIISYLIPIYLYKKNIGIIFIIMGFVVFGLIGEKRAVVFYVPVVIGVGIFYYGYFSKNKKPLYFIKYCLNLSLLLCLIFYLGARMLPSLNPDNKVGGEFDMNYAVNYALDYSSRGNIENDIPRYMGVVYFFNLLTKDGFWKASFGEGPGKLILSGYNRNANIANHRIADATINNNLMYHYYGIFYGGRMGLVWIMMQIGLVGVVLFIILIISIRPRGMQRYSANLLVPGFMASYFVIMFDMLFYSNSFIEFPYLSYMHFFIAALIRSDIKLLPFNMGASRC